MIAKVIDPRYRTFWRRSGAAFLDGIILAVPLGLIQGVAWEMGMPLPLRVVVFLISSFAAVAYSIAFHAATGQTLGKRATGVRVYSQSDGPLSLGQAVRRDIIPLLSAGWMAVAQLPLVLAGGNPMRPPASQEAGVVHMLAGSAMALWTLLELVTMLTNSRRRSVHDFIAGSVVMRVVEADLAARADAQAGVAS